MKKIEISNFKAFNAPISISLKDKQENILIYGENGSGKSSIFEALKLVFFKDKLERNAITGSKDKTEEVQKRINWQNSYLNKLSGKPSISIEIDGNQYDSIDVSKYAVFMMSNADLRLADDLSVKLLLQNIFTTCQNVESFLRDSDTVVLSYVNERLEKEFLEDIRLSFDGSSDYKICIEDSKRVGLTSTNEHLKYFNEAKLNLVRILILFACFELMMNNKSKTNLLILDDIIGSLDMANRSILINYIFKHFGGCRIIIMTHNVSYYNLFLYYIDEVEKVRERWYAASIYEYDTQNKILECHKESVQNIKNDFIANQNDPTIGNRIRQYFEVLLYEIAHILQVGPFFESQKLIDSIVNTRGAFLLPTSVCASKNVYDMVNQIRDKIKYAPAVGLKADLNKIFEKYDSENLFSDMLLVIDKLKVYQKVAMHQSSHGHKGLATVGKKEIEASLYLLGLLEKAVKGNLYKNTYTI